MYSKPSADPGGVALIGAGIVNLLTAYRLVLAGHSVALYDRAPDPCSRPDWRLLGCTAGGGDSRIFSLNEARHHLAHSGHYTDVNASPFRRPIAEGGWLAVPPEELDERDHRWIACFESVTQDLALRFNQDIIAFNQESEPLWQDMIAREAAMFRRAGYRAGLVRLYTEAGKYERALVREKAIGAVKRELTHADLVETLPTLRDAVARGRIAGALEVSGFSVNIHAFVAELIQRLTSLGVAFHWESGIDAISRSGDGRISGLMIGHDRVEARHYVLSMGAYSQHLIEGFASAEAIAPVIGMWLTIPDLHPGLARPLKITRSGYAAQGAAEGANVVSGEDGSGRPILHISSGHGYMGMNADARLFRDPYRLGRAVEETASDFFPQHYALARASADGSARRYCVRPWTASGLGLFESVETERGGSFVITGGHNTGGFAQAPAVARAVQDLLEGLRHPMHDLYHPQRLSSALQAAAVTAPPSPQPA